MKCNACGSSNLSLHYEQKGLPIIANRVYQNLDEARAVPTLDISLYFCHSCGFVFNSLFDETKVRYDGQYDNNQTQSPVFQQHLEQVADLLESKGFKKNKVVEIGCGKGDFLKLLRHRGFDVKGFDPAFEGSDENIVKDYYSNKYAADVDAGLIILRHVLEHIDHPVAFLKSIAEANDYKGSFYIEVPEFDWSIANMAFWDISIEHCNYFTRNFWPSIFSAFDCELVFDGQYLYVIAELESLKKVQGDASLKRENLEPPDLGKMIKRISDYRDFIKERAGILVWGAGRGTNFVNLVDPNREFIPAVVDINIKKHGKFIGKSGHQVIGPHDLGKYMVKDVLIINGIYKDEIKALLNDNRVNLYVLGEERVAL